VSRLVAEWSETMDQVKAPRSILAAAVSVILTQTMEEGTYLFLFLPFLTNSCRSVAFLTPLHDSG